MIFIVQRQQSRESTTATYLTNGLALHTNWNWDSSQEHTKYIEDPHFKIAFVVIACH